MKLKRLSWLEFAGQRTGKGDGMQRKGSRNLQRDLKLSTTDIWDWTILCSGGCPVHSWMLAASLASSPYMPVAIHSPPQIVDNPKCLQTLPNVHHLHPLLLSTENHPYTQKNVECQNDRERESWMKIMTKL